MKDLHKPLNLSRPRPATRKKKTVLDFVAEKDRKRQKGRPQNLIIETLNNGAANEQHQHSGS